MAVDTRNSIVLVKSGAYRGGVKLWSNRYHFEGDVPADTAAWTTLKDAIVAQEKTIFSSFDTIVSARGNDASTATSTNPHGDTVYEASFSVAGTFTPGGSDIACPGDCAALVRYTTAARSTKNHPVYLMNYYHGVFNTDAEPDQVATDQLDVYNDYAAAWVTGFSDGTGARPRCGPRGAVAIGHATKMYITHRDFPN